MPDYQTAGEKFSELLNLMAQLRSDDGCPWDRKQTHQTLKAFLLEEAYELLDALDSAQPAEISEELGDLLLQIVFHCRIGEESGTLSADQVISDLANKIVRRHPHVFGGAASPDADAEMKQWSHIKAQEKGDRPTSALGSLPRSMPALARAQTISKRAAQVGFDWPEVEPVWRKVEEELAELKSARDHGDRQRTAEELGDVFFSLVNLARFFGLQAEEVVSQATDKFIERFKYVETRLLESGKTPAVSSLAEMDRLWDQAKALRRGSDNQR